MVFCDSSEWLVHLGTVGRVVLGELHVLDEDMQPVPTGIPGTLWFKAASEFEYFKDPDKTREARLPDGAMSTVGDVGYVIGPSLRFSRTPAKPIAARGITRSQSHPL